MTDASPPLPRPRRLATWVFAITVSVLAGGPVAADSEPALRLGVWPSSIASPVFKLRDTTGRYRSGVDFHDQVTAVFFGYTRCPDVCPGELYKLALARKRLGADGKRVQVLFITLDPAHDNPTALGQYVATFDPSFIALTGNAGEIDSAAAAFHVRWARVPIGTDYTIDHSIGVFVSDARGRLRAVGTSSTSVDDYVHDFALLTREHVNARRPGGEPGIH
jgi:protein SCO1